MKQNIREVAKKAQNSWRFRGKCVNLQPQTRRKNDFATERILLFLLLLYPEKVKRECVCNS